MSFAGPERPFKIAVSEERLKVLQQKLELTTLPDELDGAAWKYGAPLEDIKRLVAYWKESFDWRAQEARLNAHFPQFTRDITVDNFETLDIHYVHQRSKVVDAIPLLFIHGWPGSFIEAIKLMPILTEASAEHPSFHFVAYSLPGYGFSDGSKKHGFGIKQYAEVGHKLMLSLGYDQYVVQGGDWGCAIARSIAITYGPKHAKAFHTNYPLGVPPTWFKNPILYLQHLLTPYTEAEKASLLQGQKYEQEGSGYFKEQSTQPQTLGYSLADSPVGLLAWIYEKLHIWTDDYPWTENEVLTWISIYLFSKSGPAASVRIYYEYVHFSLAELRAATPPVIPHGISYFPKEIASARRIFQRVNANTVFEGEHDKGGHFAATERPDALAGDLRKMFGKGGPAFGVVGGKTGY